MALRTPLRPFILRGQSFKSLADPSSARVRGRRPGPFWRRQRGHESSSLHAPSRSRNSEGRPGSHVVPLRWSTDQQFQAPASISPSLPPFNPLLPPPPLPHSLAFDL